MHILVGLELRIRKTGCLRHQQANTVVYCVLDHKDIYFSFYSRLFSKGIKPWLLIWRYYFLISLIEVEIQRESKTINFKLFLRPLNYCLSFFLSLSLYFFFCVSLSPSLFVSLSLSKSSPLNALNANLWKFSSLFILCLICSLFLQING